MENCGLLFGGGNNPNSNKEISCKSEEKTAPLKISQHFL